MIFLTKELWFPSVEKTSKEGILAIGGDLSIERLLLAYKKGIFPWFNINEPILWWCPPMRMVLFPNELRVSKSMQKILREKKFTITENTCFEKVLYHCGNIPRLGQNGSWLTDEMVIAYQELYRLGWAKSVEVWQGGELVGGFYGVDLNNVFCGESMFTKVSNASKVALIYFIKKYVNKYQLLDCQVYTDHLASLGAREIPRLQFLNYLKNDDFDSAVEKF